MDANKAASKWDVFMSHKQSDAADFASMLKEKLEKDNFRVFLVSAALLDASTGLQPECTTWAHGVDARELTYCACFPSCRCRRRASVCARAAARCGVV
jgi:hypothetical protein